MPVAKKLSKNEKNLLSVLGELGGQQTSSDSLRFEGREFIVPETMDAKGAMKFLQDFITAEGEITEYGRTFRYRPWDGAHALQSALKKLTGTTGIPKPTQTLFGTQPPEMRSINVGPNETEQVPWGQIEVPLIGGTLICGGTRHPEYGSLFHLSVHAARKYKPQVEGLFTLVENELKTASIYRGQAIDGQGNPEFLDLSGVDPAQVIYTDEVMTQLQANVWTLLQHTEKLRELGVPLKRSVLLEGPYGTGKTLAGYLTAQIAVAHGWTAIYCRPAKDDLDEVVGLARLYQPSVVFFEDVDTIAGPVEGGSDGVTGLLDTFDGINAKGTELLAVLTTNHKDRIHKGMVRPGRLDAMIEIGALDQRGLERMINATVPEHMLGDLDHDQIGLAMEGFLPAFVKEAIDRATRYNVSRNQGETTKLETSDFVEAAVGLRPQLNLMEGADESQARPALETAFAPVVREAAREVMAGAKLIDVDLGEHTHDVKLNGS